MTEAKKPDNVEVLREKATKKHEEKPAKPEGKVVKTIQLDPKDSRSVVKVKGGEWDKPEHAPVLEVAAPDVTWPPTQDNSPQVVVRGVAVEPVAALTYTGEKESITHKDITFYLPWPTERFKDTQFNIYELEQKGRKIYLAMDSLSKFTVEAENPHCFFIPGNGQLQPNSIVVMVNSSSANDYFVGESSLINVESRNNVVNNSHLEANRKDQGNQWLRFLDGTGVEKDTFKAGEHRRHSYTGCRFKRARVENCLLGDGYYLETQLTDVEIRSNGRVDVRGGRISRCRIIGSDIFLDNASLNTTTIDCSGSVRINRMSMNSEHFRTSGLYLSNKFGYTTITAPHWADLRFVRVSLNDFELSDGVHTASFKLGDGIPKVGEEIETLFNRMKGKSLEARADRNRFDSVAPDSFTRSILRYIVDSVMSRLRVIEMIDSAASTLESVSSPSNRYDPYTTPFDL